MHGPPVQTTGCNNEIARDHKNRLEHREAVWCPPIGVGEALDVHIIEKVHVMPVLTVIGILMTMFIPNYECRARLEFNNSKLLDSKIHRYIPGQQRARSLATLICACEIDNLMNNQVPEIGQRCGEVPYSHRSTSTVTASSVTAPLRRIACKTIRVWPSRSYRCIPVRKKKIHEM